MKIKTILAILLFAVSQSAFAQTALDTLQKKLQKELIEIKREVIRLQNIEYNANKKREVYQYQEQMYGPYHTTIMENTSKKVGTTAPLIEGSMFLPSSLLLEMQVEERIRRRAELQRREYEIELQLEALKKQQAEAKIQQVKP